MGHRKAMQMEAFKRAKRLKKPVAKEILDQVKADNGINVNQIKLSRNNVDTFNFLPTQHSATRILQQGIAIESATWSCETKKYFFEAKNNWCQPNMFEFTELELTEHRVYQKNNSNNWMIWFYKISPVLEQFPHAKGNLIANLAKLM